MHPFVNRFIVFLKKVIKADIIKVFSLTSISTLVRMCTGLVSVKVVASIIGPAGVALVGQLSNFCAIILNFSTGCINGGITKYVAEYKNEKSQLSLFLSNALKIVIFCSIVCGVLLVIFNYWLSELIMLSPQYGYIFIIFGITIILYALNSMLISIVNGFKEFRRYVYISIANSIIGVIFTIVLVLWLNLKGALISVVTYQSIMVIVTLWILRHTFWMKWDLFKNKFSKWVTTKYFRYSLMTMTSILTLPVVQMLLRGYVMADISPVQAGWWEGMNRISSMYLMVITSSFAVYYLPSLSEKKNRLELHKEVIKAYKVILPMIFIGFSVIYFLRFFIIRLLFTSAFLPMSQLFSWQLIGDFFKISSWLLSYIMVAKAMTKTYITTEIIFNFLYLGLGWFGIKYNGIIGLTQAYMINYILYTLVMVLIFRNLLYMRK